MYFPDKPGPLGRALGAWPGGEQKRTPGILNKRMRPAAAGVREGRVVFLFYPGSPSLTGSVRSQETENTLAYL